MLDVRFSRGKLRRGAPKCTLPGNFALVPSKSALLQGGPRRLSLNGNPIYDDRCYCSWKRVDRSRRRISLAIFLGAASSGRSVSEEVNRLDGPDVNPRPHTVKARRYGGRNVFVRRSVDIVSDVRERFVNVRFVETPSRGR